MGSPSITLNVLFTSFVLTLLKCFIFKVVKNEAAAPVPKQAYIMCLFTFIGFMSILARSPLT